jgi:hypothetical protein
VAVYIDGLREFAATEILVLPSEEKGWTKANTLAEQIRTELGLSIDELDPLRRAVPVAARVRESDVACASNRRDTDAIHARHGPTAGLTEFRTPRASRQ